MKKLISVILVVCMMVSMLSSLSVTAGAEVIGNGSCGENLTWTLDDSGTLTITGTGEMYDAEEVTDVPWTSLRENIKEVVIKSGVTTIGKNMFRSTPNLETLFLSPGVTSIKDLAFLSCPKLTKIYMPDSVKSVGYMAFEYCFYISDVYYRGNEDEWQMLKESLTVSSNNLLAYANVHCGFDFSEIEDSFESGKSDAIDGFAVILSSHYDAEEDVAYVKLGFEDDTEGTYPVGKAYIANESNPMDSANNRQSDFTNNSAFGYVVKYSIMPDGSVDLSAQDFKKADEPESNLKTFSDDGVYDGTLCGYSPYNDDTIIFMLYGQPGYDIVPPGSFLVIDSTIEGYAPMKAKAFKLSELRDIDAETIQYLCKADFREGTIDFVEDGMGSYILDDVNASKPTVLAGAMTVGRDTRHVDTIDKNPSVAYVVNAVQEYNAQTNEYYANLTLINENGLFNVSTIEEVKDFFNSSVLMRNFVGTFEDIIGAPAYININDSGKVSRLHSYKEEQREETNKNTQEGWYIVNITKREENTIYFYDTDKDVDLEEESPASLKIHEEEGCKIIGISQNQYIGETLTVLSQETGIISAEDGGNAIIEVNEGQITRIFSFKENYVYDEIKAPIIEKPVLKADLKYTYVEEYNKSKGTIKLASEKGIYNIADITLKGNIAVQTPVVYYIEDNKTVIEAVEIITGKVELFKGDGGVVIGGNTYYLWEENEEVYGDGYSDIFEYFNEDRELANNENVKYYVFGNILLKWTVGDEPAFEEEYKEPEAYSGSFEFTSKFGNADAENKNSEADFIYDDQYFSKSSYIYNHDLARMSMKVALSAFANDKLTGAAKKYEQQYQNIYDLLDNCGFEQIEYNDYYREKPKTDTVGVISANKRISYVDGDYTLIVLTMRGGNYEAEWGGNFRISAAKTHQGFTLARNEVLKHLKEYIEEKKISGKIKIWVTGYSRAAATANLTAAFIDDNPSMFGSEVSLDTKDVYAYCFETPAGTCDANRGDELYKNIFSIVNEQDFVPMLVMKEWNFGRYGITKRIPNELTMSSNRYLSLFEMMYEKYQLYTKEEYNEYLIDDFVSEKHGNNQGIFLSALMSDLARGFENATEYTINFEDALIALLGDYLGGDGELLEAFLGELLTEENVNSLVSIAALYKVLGGPVIGTPIALSVDYILVRSMINEALQNAGVAPITDETKIDKIALLLLRLVANGSAGVIYDNWSHLGLAQGHYPELCMAWMDTMEEEHFADYHGRSFIINCPVDVEVYDSENTLVAAIYDNIPQKIENSTIVAYVDENEQKIVHLPSDEEYTIKVRATADGSVTYSVQETNLETGTVDIINYNNMQLAKDDVLTGTAENLMVTEGEYALTLNEVPVTPEILDNAENYTVNVGVSGNGTATGYGTFYKGEYAKVNATAFDGEEFLGWFDGEQLITSEPEYRFAIEENALLEAKFTSNTCEILFVDGNDFVGKTRIEKGATVNYPQPIEKAGYTFTGYYIDEACTIKAEEDRTFSEDSIIYLGYKQYAAPPSSGNGGGLAAGGDKSNTGADKLGDTESDNTDASDKTDTPAVSAPKFADLGNHSWAADAINALYDAGIIKGTSATTFSPAANITRADFAILLVRAFNLTSDSTENFADVSANDYFAAELATARNTGIVGGIGGNKFAPRNAITRQDMMVIVYRALQSAKVEGIVAPEMTDEVALSKTYTDFTLVSDYAKDAASVLSYMHFVNGKNGRIAPNDYTTRAEVAVLLQRILEYVK